MMSYVIFTEPTPDDIKWMEERSKQLIKDGTGIDEAIVQSLIEGEERAVEQVRKGYRKNIT